MTTDWPKVTLGALLTDIQPGFASGKHNSVGDGVPHFRPMNVSTDGRIARTVLKYVDPYAGRPELRLRRGDVVFNNTNSPELVGKTALFEDEDAPAFSNHMTRLRSNAERLDSGYLALRLHQAWREGWFAAHCNNHVSQASISRDVLRAFEIELPPVVVQRSIAALYHQVDASRASGSSHLSMAGSAIERFRQSVLAAACSGRLTADWRELHGSVTYAGDLVRLIEQHKRARLGRRYKPSTVRLPNDELPESWCWTTAGTLVDIATGATPLRRRTEYYGGSIPWVTSGAVNTGLITDAAEHITELAIRETNAKVFSAGTLLVAMYGEGQTRGRVAELGIAAATNQAVAALLFDQTSEFLRPYIKLFFLANYERIRALSFGGVQPNLSLGAIRDTALPLPPQDEQNEIVRRVDAVLKITTDLDTKIKTAAQRVDRSSQAFLAKAFRGELSTAHVSNGR